MGWRLKDLGSTNSYILKTGDVFGRTEGKYTFPEAQKMSRSHCQFIIENNLAFILDLNSTNGVKVGIEKCEPRSKTMVGDGTVIAFGGMQFKMEQIEDIAPAWSPKAAAATSTPKASSAQPQVQPMGESVQATPKSFQFSFQVSNGEFIGLVIKNFLLTILTLGIYMPYARTNMRKYMWKSTALNKTAFLFKGEGSQLVKAYFLLFLIFIGANFVLGALEAYFLTRQPFMLIVLMVAKSLIFFLLIIRARYSSYCYLVNNTSYRSINMRVNKDGLKAHFITSLIGTILCILTLGLYYPIMALKLEKIKWINTSFGKTKFSFEANNGQYWILWIKGLVLSVVTLGIYLPWSIVALHKFRMQHVKFNGASFSSNVDGTELFFLMLKGIFFSVITLGLAAPIMYNQYLGYMIGHLSIKGSIDFESIIQGVRSLNKGSLSEAADEVFQLDAGLDVL